MGTALFFLGLIIAFVGGIMLLVEAFKESVLWGIGCLLFNPVSLVFLIIYWEQAHKPFFIQLGGIVLMFAGMFLSSSA